MPGAPQISLVIPLYNKAATVVDCVRSALGQSYPFFEIIVVDDGSTDGSAGQLSELVAENPKILLLKQENAGVSAARNAGWQAASSPFICFLDADDSLEPDYCECLCSLQQACSNASFYGTGHKRVTEHDIVLEPSLGVGHDFRGYVKDYFSAVTRGAIVNSSSVMVRRDALVATGGFPEGESVGEDLYLWARLALHSPGKTSGLAFDSRRLVRIHRYTDNSRANRVGKVPFIMTYFGQRPQALTENLSLKKYIRRLAVLHILESIRSANIDEARLRIKAIAKVFPFTTFGLSLLCVLPVSGILNTLKNLRHRHWERRAR